MIFSHKICRWAVLVSMALLIAACSTGQESAEPEAEMPDPAAPEADNPEERMAVVLLRGLPTLGTVHSVAIVQVDPEADNFGDILQEFETPDWEAPLHHLYYSPNGRLYSTGLDPQCSLAEVMLARDISGGPVINGVNCLDTEGQQVGEDIMWHSVNGQEYMFVTFMGGTGQADGGSVGVFDPQSNALVRTIEARRSEVGEGEPYIMYPHGISAYQDRMVVSSTIHPDLATGVGNAVTVIDLNTFTAIETITIEDAQPVGFPSSPVEVLFVRPSIVAGVDPAVLVNTMFGFETWKIPYNETDQTFGEPEKLYDGVDSGTGVPLEFYGNDTELFVSHAIPGVVKRYDLASLPELVPSGPDIESDLGAHHMIFYQTQSGRQVIAVQNNLLNLGDAADDDPTDIDFIAKVNAHTITVHDLETSEQLGSINFRERYNKGIDNIEGVFGSGFVHHH